MQGSVQEGMSPCGRLGYRLLAHLPTPEGRFQGVVAFGPLLTRTVDDHDRNWRGLKFSNGSLEEIIANRAAQ